MKNNRGWKMGALALAGFCLLGAAVCVQVGCAESKLNKQISDQQAAAQTADTSGAAAAQRAASDKAAIDAAALAATGPDGAMDAQKFYAALTSGPGAIADVNERAALSKAVAGGTTPSAAASTLLTQAQADAKKFADDAGAARAKVADLQSQLDAAKSRDTAAWNTAQGVASGVGGLIYGPVGAAAATGLVAMAAGFFGGKRQGQVDGATQVAQSLATIRRAVPAVDSALNAVGPYVKAIAGSTMDDHVAAAVAANKDTVAPDAAPAVLATLGPPQPAAVAA